jgi:hypothetical protein
MQFFLIKNRINARLRPIIFELLLQSVLTEFEKYLAIYTFSTLEKQFEHKLESSTDLKFIYSSIQTS